MDVDLDTDEEEELDVFREEDEELRLAQRVMAFSTTAARAPSLPETEYPDDEDDELRDAGDSVRGGMDITGGGGWSSARPLYMSSSSSSTQMSGLAGRMVEMSDNGIDSGSWNSTAAIWKLPRASCVGVGCEGGGGHRENVVNVQAAVIKISPPLT